MHPKWHPLLYSVLLLTSLAFSFHLKGQDPCLSASKNLMDEQLYQRAIIQLKECIETNESAQAHFLIGKAYRLRGKREEAESHFIQSLELNKQFAAAKMGLGQIEMDKGNLKRAAKLLDEALVLDEYDADAYNIRGVCAYRQKKYAKAITFFDQAIEYNPKLAAAHNNRGSARYYHQYVAEAHRSDIELAIQDFSRAIELDPNFTMAFRNRAMAHSFLDSFDRARSDIDKAIALDGNEYLNYFRRGQIFHDQNMYREALGEYNKALALNKDDARIYLSMGVSEHRLGNYDEAKALQNKAMAMDKGLVGVGHYNIARIYALQEERALMLKNLKRAKRSGYFKNYTRVNQMKEESDFKSHWPSPKMKRFFRTL